MIPESAAAVAARVRDARATRTPLRIVGARQWLDAGRPCRAANELSLVALRGVTEYERGDFTITARAATPLAEIDAVTAREGQWLALQPFGSADGTIGATIATASWGPLASAYGTPRDQLLGCEVVTGVGEIVRAGGRVVKNVAGFDLSRLMTGAWGTLGAITEVTAASPRAPGGRSHARHRRGRRSGRILQRGVAMAARQPIRAARRRAVLGGAGLAARSRGADRRCSCDSAATRRSSVQPSNRSPRSVRRSRWTPTCGRASARWSRLASAVIRLGALPSELGSVWSAASASSSVPAGGRTPRSSAASCAASCPRVSATRGGQRANRGYHRAAARSRGSRVVERLPAPLWDTIAARRGRPTLLRRSPDLRSGRRAQPRDPGPALVNAPTRSATPCAIPDTPLANEIAGIDACVHCGFCLQACPTYLTLEDENDSPRGRIVLMRALVEGTLARRRPRRAHAHRPLPRLSRVRDGVPVRRTVRTPARGDARHADDEAAESTHRARDPVRVRAPRPSLARDARRTHRARAPHLGAAVAPAGPIRLRDGDARGDARAAAARAATRRTGDGSRGTATLLTGCVMEGLFAETNRATERTLAANDYAMVRTRRDRPVAARCTPTPATSRPARRLARTQHRSVRGVERGLRRRQRGRLRRDDEGVRAPARARPGVARSRGDVLGDAFATRASCSRSRDLAQVPPSSER